MYVFDLKFQILSVWNLPAYFQRSYIELTNQIVWLWT